MNSWRGVDGVREVLCLGAHCDDIEIGCGGLLQSLSPEARVRALVFSGDSVRVAETKEALGALAGHTQLEVVTFEFEDGFFPSNIEAIKREFETSKLGPAPDLVLTHFHKDAHQDHRVISELTWNTFRNHFILEYEILKYDDEPVLLNAFYALSSDQAHRKAKTIVSAFASQADKPWMQEEVFRGLMRVRGVQARELFAEAFHARKVPL